MHSAFWNQATWDWANGIHASKHRSARIARAKARRGIR